MTIASGSAKAPSTVCRIVNGLRHCVTATTSRGVARTTRDHHQALPLQLVQAAAAATLARPSARPIGGFFSIPTTVDRLGSKLGSGTRAVGNPEKRKPLAIARRAAFRCTVWIDLGSGPSKASGVTFSGKQSEQRLNPETRSQPPHCD